MLKALFLSALLAPCAVALPSLSGTIRDSAKGPVDGAKVTLWDATTGRGLQTLSSKGLFSLSNVTEGALLVQGRERRPIARLWRRTFVRRWSSRNQRRHA